VLPSISVSATSSKALSIAVCPGIIGIHTAVVNDKPTAIGDIKSNHNLLDNKCVNVDCRIKCQEPEGEKGGKFHTRE
jgi:hypothetical protein